MKDARDVLRHKEIDRARIQSEIEALQLVIPLLTDDQDQAESTNPASAERLATEKRKSA
jgi:hypothetical protein